MTRLLRGLIGIVAFLALWEAFARAGFVRQEFLPPPSTVFGQLAQMLSDKGFIADAIATVLSSAIALGIATAVGVPLGLLLGSLPGVRTATRAIIEFLRPIPSVALIPLATVLIGSGPDTKISLAVYAALWPILFNTIYALNEVDPLLIETAHTFGFSRRQVLTRVALPSVTPFALTGIRFSAAVALIVVISTELRVPGAGGIGQFIFLRSTGVNEMDAVLAATVVAGAVGFLADAGFQAIRRRWLAWSELGGEPAR